MHAAAYFWAAAALLLIAAEVIMPGAFMLWLGFAAAALFVLVWLVPGMSMLTQAVAFAILGVSAIQISRRWFLKQPPASDQPTLNRRAEQLIGRVVPLDQAIERGLGRVQIADAYWRVSGPDDLPAGANVRVIGVDGMTLQVEVVN